MIEHGYDELKPLFEFRNWLSIFRDQADFRCKVRRNGASGLGPITLVGRKMILQRLLETEIKSDCRLIEKEEILRIKELWQVDENNSGYREK